LEEKKNEVKEELKKLREPSLLIRKLLMSWQSRKKFKWSDQNWKGNFTDYNWWYHL